MKKIFAIFLTIIPLSSVNVLPNIWLYSNSLPFHAVIGSEDKWQISLILAVTYGTLYRPIYSLVAGRLVIGNRMTSHGMDGSSAQCVSTRIAFSDISATYTFALLCGILTEVTSRVLELPPH